MPVLNININEATAAAIRRVCERTGCTKTQAVRQMIGLASIHLATIDAGGEIRSRKRDDDLEELWVILWYPHNRTSSDYED